ncbi:DUF58 domain-containing protein [Gimesia panareensis]|uniref:DUF58 domain-containing protein n=1 Tax=Gimesia panareensis TaxID=2527978 RepID=A0A518FK78_9PLAN|nr:DUF58 domain-containing protein [Gimesia panareensis]QDT27137.1 hypothetical protein Enr10x_24510 [Gimesia panareensis]QDU50016.1 hypothetical protein Pan110_23580 [Gimesia panareensis]QDV16700.1 hypothetical protein Pan153_13310 [Gimesia panareensis]
MSTNASPRRNQRLISQRIDPACLMRIKSLELRAKTVVEGTWKGLHRSPYHGFSVEFTEYREYTPGDDPRHIDWKLAARSNEHYIKRFEEETNLCCHMLLDLSSSMQFQSLGYSKSDYAKTLVATFAYFLSQQRDASGLIIFDEQVETVIPARFTRGQLRRILVELERPPQGSHTNLVSPLKHAVETIKKRGLVVLISDLLSPIDELSTHLGYLRAQGHEVALFQILDPSEIHLNFHETAIFEDLETGEQIALNPKAAQENYQRQFNEHQAAIESLCRKQGVHYHQLTTDTPLEMGLSEFLTDRAA